MRSKFGNKLATLGITGTNDSGAVKVFFRLYGICVKQSALGMDVYRLNGGDMRRGPEVCTLRGRIRKCKIKCWPETCHNYFICQQYPISTQTLFARNGIPLYILERELRDEGWILENESLMELLIDEKNLSRGLVNNPKLTLKSGPPIGIIELDPNTD